MRKLKRLPKVAEEVIANKIYYIRSSKVMLDKDLAELYGVKPTRLREQVRRNIQKFPPHFMFMLTKKEAASMVSQNAIPSMKHLGGFLPYAFTEHGILMLATILKSQKAIAVSVQLIEVFVKMREILSVHKDVLLKIEKLERKTTQHDLDINDIFSSLREILYPSQPPRPKIGFKRQNEKD